MNTTKSLRVLLIEDSSMDAELLELDLRRGGYQVYLHRCDTAKGMREGLARGGWDLIISDYMLPGFGGLEALEIYKESGLDIPFILLSGAVTEEVAAEAMVRGAHDCVLKDRRARLLPAIERELQECQVRREKRENEIRFRNLFLTMAQGVVYQAADGRITAANPAAERILGLSLEEMRGLTSVNPRWRTIHEDGSDLPGTEHPAMVALRTGKPVYNTIMGVFHPGENRHRWIIVNAIPQFRPNESAPFEVYASFTDITERKLMEEKLREQEKALQGKLQLITSPDVEITPDELRSILDVPALQELMNEFYAVTGIGIGIGDLNGRMLVMTGWQDICTRFHRVHPETAKNCIESDLYLSEHGKPGRFVPYRCKNHMWDIITPITVEGKHFANIYLGQFFYEDEAPDFNLFVQQAERYGFAQQEYLAALQSVPRWSREKVTHVMRFYTRLADMIARLSYSSVKLAKALQMQRPPDNQRDTPPPIGANK